MMRQPAFVKLGRFVKHVFRRCREDGCWKKGMSCGEIDTSGSKSFEEIMRTRQTFYWQCREHAMAEANSRSGPKVITVGARVRVTECMGPGDCFKHGSHEASYQSIVEGKGDPMQGPPPITGFIVKTDDGILYQAKRIELIE